MASLKTTYARLFLVVMVSRFKHDIAHAPEQARHFFVDVNKQIIKLAITTVWITDEDGIYARIACKGL